MNVDRCSRCLSAGLGRLPEVQVDPCRATLVHLCDSSQLTGQLRSHSRRDRVKLVMSVVSLPTFAPSPLRDAWGLVENRPALLRVVAPVALLRAAVTPRP